MLFVIQHIVCFLFLVSVVVYLLGYHYDSFVLGHVTSFVLGHVTV